MDQEYIIHQNTNIKYKSLLEHLWLLKAAEKKPCGWQQGSTRKQYLENVSSTGKLSNTLVNINYVNGEFEREIKPILNDMDMKGQPDTICGAQWRQCVERNE